MADFNKIAKRWQAKWEKAKIFEVKENPSKKKYFLLTNLISVSIPNNITLFSKNSNFSTKRLLQLKITFKFVYYY